MCILQLDILERNQLASRLTLNCHDSYVEPQKLKDVYVTIMDVSTIILQFSVYLILPHHFIHGQRGGLTTITFIM